MKQVDEKVGGALMYLGGNPQFKVVMEWLRESLADQDERNRNETSDVTLRQGQGKALNIAEILKMVDAAPDTLERIRSAPGRRAQNQIVNE